MNLPAGRPRLACPLKLPDEVILRFQKEVDWSSRAHVEQANAIAREVPLSYIQAHVTGGDEGLTVYHDKKDPRSLKTQFESLLDGPVLKSVPVLRAYLAGFPQGAPLDSFLYWSQEEFGLKPVVSVTHVAVYDPHDGRTYGLHPSRFSATTTSTHPWP